jgi:hypothetical protein
VRAGRAREQSASSRVFPPGFHGMDAPPTQAQPGTCRYALFVYHGLVVAHPRVQRTFGDAQKYHRRIDEHEIGPFTYFGQKKSKTVH